MGVTDFLDDVFGGGIHHYYGSAMFPLSTIDFQATDTLLRNNALTSSNYNYNIADRAYREYRTNHYKNFLQFNRMYSKYSLNAQFTTPTPELNDSDLNNLMGRVAGYQWTPIKVSKAMIERVNTVYPDEIQSFDYTGIYRAAVSTECMVKYNDPTPTYIFINVQKCHSTATNRTYDVIYPDNITELSTVTVELQYNGTTEITLTVDLVEAGYITFKDELDVIIDRLQVSIEDQRRVIRLYYDYFDETGGIDSSQTSFEDVLGTDPTYASKLAQKETLESLDPTGNMKKTFSYKAIIATPKTDLSISDGGYAEIIAEKDVDYFHLVLPPNATALQGLFNDNDNASISSLSSDMSPLLELLADGSAENLSVLEKNFLKYLNLDVNTTLDSLEDSEATDVKAMTGVRPMAIRSSLEPMLLYETLSAFIEGRSDLTTPANVEVRLDTHTDLVDNVSTLLYNFGEVSYTYGAPLIGSEDEYEYKSYIHNLLIQGDEYVMMLHPYLASVLARTMMEAIALYNSEGTSIELDATTQAYYDKTIVSLFADDTLSDRYIFPYYEDDEDRENPNQIDQIGMYDQDRADAGTEVINNMRTFIKQKFDIDLPDPDVYVTTYQDYTGNPEDDHLILNGNTGTPMAVGIKLWYDAVIKLKEYLYNNFLDNLDDAGFISHRFAEPRLYGPFTKLYRAFPAFVYLPNTDSAVKRYNKKISLVSDGTEVGANEAYSRVSPATYSLSLITIDFTAYREGLADTVVGKYTKPLDGYVAVPSHPNALDIYKPNPEGSPNKAMNKMLRSTNYDDFGYKVDTELVDIYALTNAESKYPSITTEHVSATALDFYPAFHKVNTKGVKVKVSRLNKKTKVVETITVGSMSANYFINYIAGNTTLKLTEDNTNFVLPFQYSNLSAKDKVNKTLSSYLFKTNTIVLVWADQEVYVKWTETEAFAIVLQIIAIVIAIVVSLVDYTGTTQSFILGMAQSYAIGTAVNYVVGLLELSPELSAFITIIATAFITNGFSFENLSESLATDLWLQGSTTLLHLFSDKLAGDLAKDMNELQTETEELIKKKDMYDVDPVVHANVASGLRFFTNYFTQAPEIVTIVDNYADILESGTIPDSLFEFDYRMARSTNVYPYDPS